MRRALRSSLCLAMLALLSTVLAVADPVASAVRGVSITVSSLDRSIDFYTQVLGFRVVSRAEMEGSEFEHLKGVFGARARVAVLQLGEEQLELTEFFTHHGEPLPSDSRSNDGWFQHIAIVVSDMDVAYARLRQFGVVHASTSPQTLPAWNKNAGGIRAFYFRDPDGHSLELIWFPPGKGLAKWHQADGPLFRGIDHTAIVVRDTDRSVTFYRDALGLNVVGASENYGVEQERLNNVFGVRLRITSLRAATGPGIELLEYLAPRDGRESPSNIHANDLAHWETLVQVHTTDEAWRTVRSSKLDLISSDVEHVASAAGDYQAFLAKDPDHHAIEFISTEPKQTATAANQVK
jgi:catechol 2,3-dioxygenase-like lactoylglutathione lyase family enzyme